MTITYERAATLSALEQRLSVATTRVDAIPLVYAHLRRMQLDILLDQAFQRPSAAFGQAAMLWITAILSGGALRTTVDAWFEQYQSLIKRLVAPFPEPHVLTKVQMHEMLTMLSDTRKWKRFESVLSSALAKQGITLVSVALLDDAIHLAQEAQQQLHVQVDAATTELTALDRRRRNKPGNAADMRAAADAIITAHNLHGIMHIGCEEHINVRVVRRYGGRPNGARTEHRLVFWHTVDHVALQRQAWRRAWWAYASTMPVGQLSLTGALLAYRSACLFERGHDPFGQLLTMSHTQRPDHEVTGLLRLLTIAAHALTVLDERALRHGLKHRAVGCDTTQNTPLIGEQLIGAFNGITLTTLISPGAPPHPHLTELTAQQRLILELLDLPADTYDRLVA